MSETAVTAGDGAEGKATVAELQIAGSPETDPVLAQEPSPPESLTPGKQLQAARIARGMSVRDVADVLRFSPRQIELLEEDRYEQLPGATLVRGFVRGYAKLLKLDAAPLLAALTPDVPPSAPEVRPPMNMGEANEGQVIAPARRSQRQWGSLAAGVVLLLAIGLVIHFVRSAMPPSVPAVEKGAAAPAGTVVVPPATQAVVAEAAPVPAPTAESVMPPVAALVLEFDGLSWIEVRDATQKVVFVGEYPKGTRQQVSGQAPFQLWVGKASAVRVTYGERSVDLKPHTREDVARLTIE